MILRPTCPVAARRKGISLLEVLLALAILVIALAAISRLVDIGTDRSIEARAHSRGTRLAEGKMAEVEAGVIALGSDVSGQFEGDDAVWSFTVTSEAADQPNLYAVTVRVSREVKGQPIEIVLCAMIYDPQMLGSAAQAERTAEPDEPEMPGMGETVP